MAFLDKLSRYLNRVFLIAGGCFLVAMILVTCGNIFFRIVWLPVRGTFELMGFFGAIVASFALGYTQIERGHIAVDILITRFSRTTRRFLDFFNSLICMIFFALAAWQIAAWGNTIWKTGEVSETLQIPYYPFVFGAALGFGLLSFVLLTDVLRSVLPQKEDEK